MKCIKNLLTVFASFPFTEAMEVGVPIIFEEGREVAVDAGREEEEEEEEYGASLISGDSAIGNGSLGFGSEGDFRLV